MIKIEISSWTSSFRFPNMISGYQPTLPIPPLATIHGLLSACKGDWVDPSSLELAYYFYYETRFTDLETIYMIENLKKAKSNVIKREQLMDCKLHLYLNDEWCSSFQEPYFPLLLGRSSDLASVTKIESVEVESVNEVYHVQGQLVPFEFAHIGAQIMPTPICYTNEIERRILKTKIFGFADPHQKISDIPIQTKGFYDKSEDRYLILHRYFEYLK